MLGLVLPELRPGLGGEPAEVANAGFLVPLLTIVFLVPLQSSVTVENRLTVIALKPDMTPNSGHQLNSIPLAFYNQGSFYKVACFSKKTQATFETVG